MTQTALVLQGGGALGAYECGVIKRLYEDPEFVPEIISGVSIGAINAAVLVGARGDPIETLEHLWQRFGIISPPFLSERAQEFLSLWGNASFFRMRYDYFNAPNWTSFYSTDPLRRELEEHIDPARIAESPTRLLVAATNIETGQPTVFDNRRDTITIDHIVASASLPPGFPITQIDGQSYWDGGLFDNTPLAPVIERLTDERERRLIVVNVFPSAGRVPRNMLDVLDRIFELIFANKLVFDVETARKVNEFVEAMDAIEEHVPQSVKDLPGYRRLRNYKYIQDLLTIENRDPETVSAPFDFSKASIQRRIAAGYRDASQALALRSAMAAAT